MISQVPNSHKQAANQPTAPVSLGVLRDASGLADLDDGQRWIVAHKLAEASGRSEWWWYIGGRNAGAFQRQREAGLYESAQRRTEQGWELIAWKRGK